MKLFLNKSTRKPQTVNSKLQRQVKAHIVSLLWRFFSDSFFFSFKRFSTEALLGFVARLIFGAFQISSIYSSSLCLQAVRFIPRSRNWSHEITNCPFLFILLPYFCANRCFCAPDNPLDSMNSQSITTLELTLLTFCPPGPELRTY